jgi:hypothetical protein
MHFLIDADSLIYKAGCSNETRSYLVEDTETGIVLDEFQYKKDAEEFISDLTEDVTLTRYKEAGHISHSLANLKNSVQRIVDHPKCTHYTVFVGGSNNFRYEIYADYKASRDELAKPLHYRQLHDYLVRRWKAEVVDGEEVDDRISIIQSQSTDETCIASIDKDLNNTAGWHYNYDKDDMYYLSPQEADLNFYRQLITGDKTVDNIPALPRYGLKKAAAILPEYQPIEDMCRTVWDLYQEKGYDWDYFVMNGQLLWMRREEEEYWQPPIERTL